MFKKLLATPCILSLFFGCGKEIESTKEKEKVFERPALESSNILLEVTYQADIQNNQKVSHELPNDGWARIPEKPIVLIGSPLTFKTKITFNESPLSILNQIEVISCNYLSVKLITPIDDPPADGYNHYFKGCFTMIDGEPEKVNYEPGQEFPFNKGNLISFEVNSSDSLGTLQIQSDIDVDWH